MVLMAGLCLSIAGVTLRHLDSADGWQVLFYRSVTFSVTVFVFIAVRYRGRVFAPFRTIGWSGVVVAVALGIGSVCYVFSLLLTTVANAQFILATSPFVTALLAWAVLRERIGRGTWITMAAASLGIGAMVYDSIGGGRLLGNLVAFGAVAMYAIMLVTLRRSRAVDMVPATCLAGVFGAVIAGVMVDDFAVSAHDLGLAVMLGTVQYAGGFVLITLGSRHVPAAEVALLSLTETVAAPLWVWIGVNEVPSPWTLAGGALVLCAVVGQTLTSIRRDRRRRAATPGR